MFSSIDEFTDKHSQRFHQDISTWKSSIKANDTNKYLFTNNGR